MKTRKLILWSGIIQILGLIGMIGSYICIVQFALPREYVAIPFVIYMIMLFISGMIISFSIREKVWLTLYDETVKIKEENKKSWNTTNDYIKMLGNHEAIKLYSQTYPDKVPLKFYPFKGQAIKFRRYWVKTEKNSAIAHKKDNGWFWLINGKPILESDIKLIYDFPENL